MKRELGVIACLFVASMADSDALGVLVLALIVFAALGGHS